MTPPSTPDTYPPPEAFDDIVTINAGVQSEENADSTKAFKVHKGVLSFYSGYFDACLNGEFVEAHRGVVELPEEDVETFKNFVGWLYTRNLPIDHDSESSKGQFGRIVNLWLLADRRQVPLLANRCINALRELVVVRDSLPIKHMHSIYASTTEDSQLRRFMVLVITAAGDVKHFMADEIRDLYPSAAVWDILKSVWRNRTMETMTDDEILDMDMCQYHQHEEGVRCPEESTAHIKCKTRP